MILKQMKVFRIPKAGHSLSSLEFLFIKLVIAHQHIEKIVLRTVQKNLYSATLKFNINDIHFEGFVGATGTIKILSLIHI